MAKSVSEQTDPVTALHVDPGYVTLGTSTGTDNSWINNVEDGNLELVNEGRSTNDGAVRINRKNNPAGDTTYFRDTVIYDGKSNVVLFVDGSEGSVGIGTDAPLHKLAIGGNSTQTLKSTVAITDMTNGASLALRGQSPTIFLDSTSGGVPKILMDGRGIEFKDGTLDNQGNVDVKIDATGNVGIGTDAPTFGKLEVNGPKYILTDSGQARGGVHVSPDSSATSGQYGGAISFSGGGSGSAAIASINDGGSDHDSVGLAFITHPTGTGSDDAQEKMRITEVGNVGIGTILQILS